MKLIYISSFFDGLMLFLGSFLLFCCFFGAIGLPHQLCAVFSLIISLIFFILFLRLNLTSSQKRLSQNTLSKKKNAFKDMLVSLNNEDCAKFFIDNVLDKSLVTNSCGNLIYNGYRLIFLFLPENVTANEISLALKGVNKGEKAAVFATAFDKSALVFCRKTNTLAFCADEIYGVIAGSESVQSLTAKKQKRLSLNNFKFKFNFKRSLFFGIALLILSNFSFFPIYYRISGCIFTIYAIVIAVLGKIQPNSQSNISDFLRLTR